MLSEYHFLPFVVAIMGLAWLGRFIYRLPGRETIRATVEKRLFTLATSLDANECMDKVKVALMAEILKLGIKPNHSFWHILKNGLHHKSQFESLDEKTKGALSATAELCLTTSKEIYISFSCLMLLGIDLRPIICRGLLKNITKSA